MRRFRGGGPAGLLLCALLAAAPPGAAAGEPELTIEAEVDRTALAAGEILHLTVTVTGDLSRTPEVSFEPPAAFRVVSTGQSQRIQVKGGQMRQAVLLTYSLKSTEAGTFTLGPASVKVGDKTIKTRALEVTVRESSGESREPGPPAEEKSSGGIIL